MYEEHPEIETPPDDAVIWRYMDIPLLLALLHSSGLYLCRLDNLRDPWEGHWPTAILDAARNDLDRIHVGIAENMVKVMNEFPKSFFVNCWHESVGESAAFWDHYGYSRGVAIKSTVGRLKQASRTAERFFVGRVKYLDYEDPDLAVARLNALAPAFLKRHSFSHEHEVRVLVWEVLLSDSDPEKVTRFGLHDSLTLPVDLPMLIDSVYISPALHSWLIEPVRELLQRFRLELPVKRSQLYDREIK